MRNETCMPSSSTNQMIQIPITMAIDIIAILKKAEGEFSPVVIPGATIIRDTQLNHERLTQIIESHFNELNWNNDNLKRENDYYQDRAKNLEEQKEIISKNLNQAETVAFHLSRKIDQLQAKINDLTPKDVETEKAPVTDSGELN